MDKFLKITAWMANIFLWTICLIPMNLKMPSPITRADLFYHALSYTLVTCAFLLAYPRLVKWILPGLILQGIAIEFIQPLSGRFFEEVDMIANSVGVIFAYLIWKFFLEKFKHALFKKFNLSC